LTNHEQLRALDSYYITKRPHQKVLEQTYHTEFFEMGLKSSQVLRTILSLLIHLCAVLCIGTIGSDIGT
jgi:hypothetical protein